ncbi:MAG: thiamine pyrophosphate-dependent enzyme, partial [Spirochaetes bacterium]|nr:thiamine pyrophosphate-dependent enzyme [Spirochaetota bacterium]
TTQEGEVMEAIDHAVREGLPVLFLIQDNSLAISPRTRGKTFFSLPGSAGSSIVRASELSNGSSNPVSFRRAESFYGLPIRYFNGRDPEEAYQVFREETQWIRTNSSPRILVMEVERIGSHSNADDQRLYRSEEEIASVRALGDPVQKLRKRLLERGVEEKVLLAMEEEIRRTFVGLAEKVRKEEDPKPVFTAVKPYEGRLIDPASERTGRRPAPGEEGKTMLEAIREVLRARLQQDPRVVLFGEDIEDPKGDVFGVTRGLSTDFPGRVKNSPLAESTIVGASIGRALAGDRPVAFLQFADFMPVAYNQIFSELACMYWRTDGSWQAPVILMVTCGAYRPGLGPFHASTLEALVAHTPGLDVFMPSTAADAAGLLNAAFESGRPTVFFYPKTLLNDRDRAVVGNPLDLFVPPGKARLVREGDGITLVGWGNTVLLCERAAQSLEEAGVNAEVIDLRSIVPWDVETVVKSALKTGRLIVTHEDTHTAGMGAEVAATVAEAAGERVRIRRITRPDTWVPFHFENQLEVLPSYKRILEAAVEMLNGTIRWERPLQVEAGTYLVEAIGSSPADESVTVLTWKVKPGDTIRSGQSIAELEADKAALELNAPVDGTVMEILVREGEMVKVGTPLLKLRLIQEGSQVGPGEVPLSVDGELVAEEKEPGEVSKSGGQTVAKTVLREDPGKPVIQWKTTERASRDKAEKPSKLSTGPFPRASETQPKASYVRRNVPVALLGITGTVGGRLVSNEEISRLCPSWKPEDIVKRTGIAQRPWIAEGETALSLAVDACRKLLQQTGVSLNRIKSILCATGTPIYNTPSMATLIHYQLGGGGDEFIAQAHDINAACSGYLYGLQAAYDFLQSEPDGAVLLVTTEVLSSRTNHEDPITAPIFADAATATLLVGGEGAEGLPVRIHRPVLAAKGEPGESLRVPSNPEEKIFMEGQKVFLEAVKGMMRMLDSACERAGLTLLDLDLVVPHQANQRIINAVRQKYRLPEEKVYSNIRNLGNTSSSTIPLCLEQILDSIFTSGSSNTIKEGLLNKVKDTETASPLGEKRPIRIGLTAFGGGFTFGGGIIEVVK